MIFSETKKYLFNTEQESYFEDIHDFVFLNLIEEQKKHLRSNFFSDTPYRYGLIIQVDDGTLVPHCQMYLIHKILAGLERNSEQPELIEKFSAYLKLNPKKIQKPIDAELFQDIDEIIGTKLAFCIKRNRINDPLENKLEQWIYGSEKPVLESDRYVGNFSLCFFILVKEMGFLPKSR